MTQINIDTTKIRECGTEIIELSKEMNEIITTMFTRINNMNVTTGEWVGASANLFTETAKIDELQYLNIKSNIYNYGKFLLDYADTMEQKINEVKE